MRLRAHLAGWVAWMLVCTVTAAQQPPETDPDKDKDKDKETKIYESAYYPLTPGRTWTYVSPDGEFTIKAVKKEDIGDYPNCIRLETSKRVRGKETIVAYEHVRITKDWVQRCAYQGEIASPPLNLLPTDPAAFAMNEWAFSSEVGGIKADGKFTIKKGKQQILGMERETATVVSNNVKINLIDGERPRDVKLTYVYAKGVGMVEQTITIDGRDINVKLTALPK